MTALRYLVFVSFLVVVQSSPKGRIIEYKNELNTNGYNFVYRIDDGTVRHESGSFVTGPGVDDVYQVTGDHYFKFPDDTPFELYFTADENGYRPRYTIGGSSKGNRQQTTGGIFSTPIPSSAIASLAGGGLGK